MSFGERLVLEKAVLRYRRPGRQISVQSWLWWSERSRGRFKRVRLSRKNPAHEAFQGIERDQPRLRVWKRLKVSDCSLVSDEEHVHLSVGAPVQDEVGVG